MSIVPSYLAQLDARVIPPLTGSLSPKVSSLHLRLAAGRSYLQQRIFLPRRIMAT